MPRFIIWRLPDIAVVRLHGGKAELAKVDFFLPILVAWRDALDLSSWSCLTLLVGSIRQQSASHDLSLLPPHLPPQAGWVPGLGRRELNTEVLAIIPLAVETQAPASFLGCLDISHTVGVWFG